MRRKRRNLGKKVFQDTFTILQTFSRSRILMSYQHIVPGIMPSNSYLDRNIGSIARSTHSVDKNKNNLTNSSTKTSTLDKYAHPNPLWLHHSFLSRKRTELYDQSKTIVN